MSEPKDKRVLALCGGIGGAKLALGLSRLLPEDRLTVVVNTGDDFEHLGLHISPDIDTVSYTLAGLNDEEKGWGRADETWNFMDTLRSLGGEDWFNLGDRDLALHIERTRRLNAGQSLSRITKDMCKRFGVHSAVVPMSDDPVRTVIDTDAGRLEFQHYFVREQCRPRVHAVEYAGAERAKPSNGFTQALGDEKLDAIVICPSNPYLSIDPILAVKGVRDMLSARSAPLIAVSPLAGGRAIKGPTAKIMSELNLEVSALSIAEHYGSLIDGYMIDVADDHEIERIEESGVTVRCVPTIMRSFEDRIEVARHVIDFAEVLKRERKFD